MRERAKISRSAGIYAWECECNKNAIGMHYSGVLVCICKYLRTLAVPYY